MYLPVIIEVIAYEVCGVAVYAAHTNLDAAPRGLAWELARRAGATDIRFFGAASSENRFKLVVFVPEDHIRPVHRAMARKVLADCRHSPILHSSHDRSREVRDDFRITVQRAITNYRTPPIHIQHRCKT